MEKNIDIPFHKPFLNKEEVENIAKVIRLGNIGGNGPVTKKVQDKIKELFKIKYALLTTSCTHAIELSLMALDIMSGDEVICPSFTFVSTANAILHQGARPVFVEIDEGTLNIDPNDIERRITNKTKAIIPVHYAGAGCKMDEMMNIAKKYNLFVVEDAAQGVNAKYKGKYLGTIGDIGCYSFHETKNITCGEGGVLITNNEIFFRQAEIMGEKGTNRSAFLRGEVDKYTWIDFGSSYVLSDILAAILDVQFRKIGEIQEKREKIYKFYLENLQNLANKGKLKLPFIPKYCQSNYHIFYILLPNEEKRNYCLDELKKYGIHATFHYIPLHSSPYGKKVLGYKEGDFSVTESVSRRLLRLPIYPDLKKNEMEYIVESLHKILK